MTSPKYENICRNFSYNSDTGVVSRKSDGTGASVGSTKNSVRINWDGTRYQIHEIAYCLGHGQWPMHYVDHINSDCMDNRLSNLKMRSESEDEIGRLIEGMKLGSEYPRLIDGMTDAQQREAYRYYCRLHGLDMKPPTVL